MRVFLTGATGWVGSAVVGELVLAGHRVSGLVRSEEAAITLAESGAEAVVGELEDLAILVRAASAADAVVHTAFNHDFSRFAASSEQERLALEAVGEELAGSGRRLLVTSGLAMLAPGRIATEEDRPSQYSPRRAEAVANDLTARGVAASTLRLAPTVHGVGEHGFIAGLIAVAREKGVSAYVGDGSNRWPAVHRSDVARLYRLALEDARPAAVYHAVTEEGIAFRDIAEMIGRRLRIPVGARDPDHFGWLGVFAGADMPASSKHTRDRLGWIPSGPSLADDLNDPEYIR